MKFECVMFKPRVFTVSLLYFALVSAMIWEDRQFLEHRARSFTINTILNTTQRIENLSLPAALINSSSASNESSPNPLPVTCNGEQFGPHFDPQMVRSCRDVARRVADGGSTQSFGTRLTGDFDVELPQRILSCKFGRARPNYTFAHNFLGYPTDVSWAQRTDSAPSTWLWFQASKPSVRADAQSPKPHKTSSRLVC